MPVYDPAVSLTKPARVFRVLAPVASAPERVGPRECVFFLGSMCVFKLGSMFTHIHTHTYMHTCRYVDVLLDGREELVLPFGSDGAGAHDEDMDSEGVDSTAAAAASALERVLREADLGFGGSSGSSKSDSGAGGGSGNNGGPEAERRAWSRLLSEGGLRVGAVLDVSEEVGPGFVSFLAGPRLALPALLQEHRDLLILARGTAGMAAVASALDWPKVGAHAKAGGGGASTAAAEAGKPLHPHPHHHAHAPAHAPHPHRGRPRITVLLEQDSLAAHDPLRGARARWQAALGSSVRVIPVLRPLRRPQHGGKGHGKGAAASSSTGGASGGGGVEAALFKGEAGGFSPVLGIDPRECAVLVAGMGQRRRARLATSLLRAGVHPARILDHSLDLARGPGVAPPVERCEQLPPGLAAPCCASCGSGSGSGSSSSSWR